MYRLETGESEYDSVKPTGTVFQSEGREISVCARNLLDEGRTRRNIVISSDNQSALQALQENRMTSLKFGIVEIN